VIVACGVMLVLGAISLVRGGPLTSATIDGLEAGEADALVESITGHPIATTLIVHFRGADSLDGAELDKAIERALAPLRSDARVRSILEPREALPPLRVRMIAPKKHAAFALVTLAGDFTTARKAYEDVRAKVKPDRGLSVAFTGQVAYMHDLDATLEKDLIFAEMISLPLALVVLLLVFRTAVAAAVPVMVGALAVSCGVAIVFALSHVMPLAQYTINICSLIGLGVAIDYSLFTVSRYREELIATNNDYQKALARTLDKAGRVVLFSGLAVATGLSGLFFFHGSFLFAMGVGGSIVVTLAVLFALTFLPALLAVLGPRIHSGRLPIPARFSNIGEGAWHRWASWVMKRPVLALAVSLVVLLSLGSPFMHLRLAAADVRVLPSDVEARAAWDRMSEDFPDETAAHADIVVTFPSTPALNEARIRGLFDLSRRVVKIPGVKKVESIVDRERSPDDEPEDADAAKDDLVSNLLDPSDIARPMVEMGKKLTVGERSVLLRATLDGPPDGAKARDAVRAIRQTREVADGGRLVVGGQTATDIDTTAFMLARAPRAGGFVIGVMLLVLVVLLESVLLPIKAVLMNALSIAGSFGAVVYIFQDGHFIHGPGGPLEPALPVVLFCALFGLSMDYEVLMLSRMKEVWETSQDNEHAVAEGLEKTAGLVTSAAAIMVVVFIAFALARVVIVQAVGVGMALAVALDATLVRVLLVPSTMRLLGRLNWWAPSFLRRK